jgi:hypothetical protein
MFRVHLFVCLVGRDGEVGLWRWLSLPFAPFPQLKLYGITSNPDQAETVQSVGWDVADSTFEVVLVDYSDPEEVLADLIDEYGPEWEQCKAEPEARKTSETRLVAAAPGGPSLRLHLPPTVPDLRVI